MRVTNHIVSIGTGILLAVPLSGMAATYKAFDFHSGNRVATVTEAFGINDHNVIAGSYCKDGDNNSTCAPPGSSPSHGYLAFKTKKGLTFRQIDFPKAFETEATSVNNNGLVVGLYDPKAGPAGVDRGRAYYCKHFCKHSWDFVAYDYPGTKTQGSTDFYAANNRGEIIGNYALTSVAPIVDHGFLLDHKGRTCTIDVPGAGASDTNTLGLNDESDAVGSFSDEATGRVMGYVLMEAEIETNGAPCKGTYVTFEYPLAGVLQTEASGINEDGVIVGNYLDSNQVSHAFRRSRAGTFTTIDFPASGDNAGSSINEDGVIVGNFTELPSNKERAFIRYRK